MDRDFDEIDYSPAEWTPTSRRVPVRPPWAVGEALFVARCDGCGDCIQACQSRILLRGNGGYPELEAMLGGCDFCGECADTCTKDAFSPVEAAPWARVARLGTGCLTRLGVVCQLCGEVCEDQAIDFPLRAGPGEGALPSVDAATCSGCGACLPVCPVQSISLRERHQL